MKHLLLNLKSFYKNDRLIIFIMIICVVTSAFIINFSYGLYYNYNFQKYEVEVDIDELQQYVLALDNSTLSEMMVI